MYDECKTCKCNTCCDRDCRATSCGECAMESDAPNPVALDDCHGYCEDKEG